jgi:hypothetical protein
MEHNARNTALGLIVTYLEINGESNALRRVNKTVWSNSEEIPSFKSYVNVVTLGAYHAGKSAVVGRCVITSILREFFLRAHA